MRAPSLDRMPPPEPMSSRPSQPRSLPRRAFDRCLTVLARTALRAFLRTVEVVGRGNLPTGRPVLIVSNHFNGFLDPVVLIHVFGKLPRFLAKSTLWERPGLPLLCGAAGMIPIHRPQDGEGVDGNSDIFRTCHEVLAQGDTVGIFPEGFTHDLPALQHIHTGAARIALGAYAAGAPDLVVVPVGLTYEDKLALRSRALAEVGEPIDLRDQIDALVPSGTIADADNHLAVTALTGRIAEGMSALSPDYATAHQARALGRVGEIAARTGREPGDTYVTLRDQEEIARTLSRRSRAARERVLNAMGRYQLDLDLLRMRDHLLVPGYRGFGLARRTLWSSLLIVVLAVPALVGVAWNGVPALLVRWAGDRTKTPVKKGTVRLSVALGAFPLMWLTVALVDPFTGFWPGLAVFVAAPLLGLLAVGLWEEWVRDLRAWLGWASIRARAGMVDEVLANRADLIDAVDAALEERVE